MTTTNQTSLSKSDELSNKLLCLRISLAHKARWGRQFVGKPDMCLIGEYHGGNVGDMALAYSLQDIVRSTGKKSYLQTLHNLDTWPDYGGIPAIVGGGTILNAHSLERLANRFKEHPERLALLGVDYAELKQLNDHRDFLNQVGMLTFRSQKGAKEVGALIGNDNIQHHWDLAFGMRAIDPTGTSKNGKTLGFNVLPLYSQFAGGKFVLSWGGDKDHIPVVEREAAAYVELVRGVLKHYQSLGYKLVHVPFAPEDDIFARVMFGDYPVQFETYTNAVKKTQAQFKKFDLFLSTRYHSLIFSLIQRVPCIPISYGAKCDSLLHDLDVTRFEPLFLPTLMRNPEAALQCAIGEDPVQLPQAQLNSMREEVEAVVKRAVAVLFKA